MSGWHLESKQVQGGDVDSPAVVAPAIRPAAERVPAASRRAGSLLMLGQQIDQAPVPAVPAVAARVNEHL